MTGITIKVLHGADRGKVFHDLTPPVTIGREEGNSVQLKDDRVSRCHVKIQRDNDRLVLTDLGSTNGTKVNNNECHLKILKHGDLITVGKTMLLLGTEEQIAARFIPYPPELPDPSESRRSNVYPLGGKGDDSPRPNIAVLPACEPPSLPGQLSPAQAAQLAELLSYVQDRLHRLIESARIEEAQAIDAEGVEGKVMLRLADWRQLLDVQVRLSELYREIDDPQPV